MGNIITILIVLVGLVGLFLCLRSLARNRSSLKWPTVPGKVTSSMVKTIGFGEDTRQRAEVIYQYTVGEKTMQSGRVSFADDYADTKLTDAEIADKVRRYPVGEEVTVYFDPKDPRESVLEPTQKNTTMYVAMAACLIVIAGTLWWRISVYKTIGTSPEQLKSTLTTGSTGTGSGTTPTTGS